MLKIILLLDAAGEMLLTIAISYNNLSMLSKPEAIPQESMLTGITGKLFLEAEIIVRSENKDSKSGIPIMIIQKLSLISRHLVDGLNQILNNIRETLPFVDLELI
jgi:hypothetical protein